MLNLEFSESFIGDREENLDRSGHIKGNDWSLSYLLDGYETHTPHYVDVLAQNIHDKCAKGLDKTQVIESLTEALILPEAIQGKASAIFIICINNTMHVMNAGDTRAYLLKSRQKTKDHSQVQFLIEKGKIKAQLANTHPLRRYLRKSLNSSSSLDSLDLIKYDQIEDVLLCSDGFWSNYQEEDIFAINTIEKSTEKFKESKNKRPGESDNQTLLLLKCPP